MDNRIDGEYIKGIGHYGNVGGEGNI
jgi:hypothetical protein